MSLIESQHVTNYDNAFACTFKFLHSSDVREGLVFNFMGD